MLRHVAQVNAPLLPGADDDGAVPGGMARRGDEDHLVGDVVLARGTVRTDQDFGSGYAYKVLIEDATLQK